MFSVFMKLITGFSLFAILIYIDGVDSIVSSCQWKKVAFTQANKKQQAFDRQPLKKSKLHFRDSSKRKWGISIISDPPFTNLVRGSDRNEHDAFEGHEKGHVTSKVSDHPFINFIKRSDSEKEPLLIR